MVDAVLGTHHFMGLWFPQDQKQTEHVSSNLQFHEFAARLESRRRTKRIIWKRSKSNSNWESDCEVGKLWVSGQTITKQIKIETQLLLCLGTLIQNSFSFKLVESWVSGPTSRLHLQEGMAQIPQFTDFKARFEYSSTFAKMQHETSEREVGDATS